MGPELGNSHDILVFGLSGRTVWSDTRLPASSSRPTAATHGGSRPAERLRLGDRAGPPASQPQQPPQRLRHEQPGVLGLHCRAHTAGGHGAHGAVCRYLH